MKSSKLFKTLALVMSAFILVLSLSACSGESADASKQKTGTLVIELYPEYAPETVENFLKLVNSGFYNGLTFHRIVDNFMAQGGDPDGTGNGGSDPIYGEFSENGFAQNTLSHDRGVISMARTNDPNSASSQFFICTKDVPEYDGQYAAFGKVVSGMEVIDDLSNVERTTNSMGELATPVNPVTMASVSELSNYESATEGHSYVEMTISYTVK